MKKRDIQKQTLLIPEKRPAVSLSAVCTFVLHLLKKLIRLVFVVKTQQRFVSFKLQLISSSLLLRQCLYERGFVNWFRKNQTPVKTLFISGGFIFYLVSLQRFYELCDVTKEAGPVMLSVPFVLMKQFLLNVLIC